MIKEHRVKKRAISMLLSLAMVMGLIIVSDRQIANASEKENLLVNGDFEKVGNWVDQDGVDVPAQGEKPMVETVYAYQDGFDAGAGSYTYVSGKGSHAVEDMDGNKVVKITNESTAGDWYTLGTTIAGIPVESGKTYHFSFQVKSKEKSKRLCFVLFVQSWDSQGKNYANSGNVVVNADAVSDSWTEVSVDYTVPENRVKAQLRIQERWSTEYYIDDIYIYYPVTEIETIYTQGIGNCKGTETGNVLVMQEYTGITQPVSLEEGVVYEYSFRVKSVDTGSDFSFGLQAGAVTEEITPTDDWQTITGRITGSSDMISFGFYCSGTGTVYIDDVSLFDASPEGVPATLKLNWMHTYSPGQVALVVDKENTGSAIITTSNEILINGSAVTRNFQHHPGTTLGVWLGGGILSETERNTITIPQGTKWNDANGKVWYYLENDFTFYTEKIEGYWMAWDSRYDYPAGTNVQYVDMGSGLPYMFANTTNSENNGMSGVMVVEGRPDLTPGSDNNGDTNNYYRTTSELGDYHVIRTIGTVLYDYKVALYKRGNAHDALTADETADVLDVRDLVAVKKVIHEEDGTSGYARRKAADANTDGKVDEADAKFLRETLVNGWDIMTVTKGETVLDQGVMPVIGFSGPDHSGTKDRLTEESYRLLQEMGFNVVVSNTIYANNSVLYTRDTLPALEYAQKYGIKVYLNDSLIADQVNSTTVTDTLLAQRAGQHNVFDSFAGFYIADEPTYDKNGAGTSNARPIRYFQDPLTKMLQYANNHSYLNLFPYDSNPLGWDMEYNISGGVNEENYKKYQDRANEAGVEVISYDMYLRPNGQNKGSDYGLKYKVFYQNLDWTRTNSRRYGKTFQAFVQAGTDFESDNGKKTDQSYLTTRQEMYLEANAALAMGAKGIQYFNAMQAPQFAKSKDGTTDLYRSGLINVEGKPNYGENGAAGDGGTYNYFDTAKKINHYIAAIDEVLMNASNQGVITTNDTIRKYIDGAAIDSYGAVTKVVGDDAFVGCFSYYGKAAYLVVNTSVTELRSIQLDFGGVTKNYRCIDMSLLESTGNASSLELSIGAGESVFVLVD